MVRPFSNIAVHQVGPAPPGLPFKPANANKPTRRALADENETKLRVYMTRDSPDVYEDSFMATATSDDGIFKPTIILISTRLGIDKITQVYWEALIAALQMPQSIGIAGYVPVMVMRTAILTRTVVAALHHRITSSDHKDHSCFISTPTIQDRRCHIKRQLAIIQQTKSRAATLQGCAGSMCRKWTQACWLDF